MADIASTPSRYHRFGIAKRGQDGDTCMIGNKKPATKGGNIEEELQNSEEISSTPY